MMTLLLLLNQQPHHRLLLDTARNLLQTHRESAVVVAMTACEVFTEQVLALAYEKRGVKRIADAIEELLPGHNLQHDKVRALYTALTEDEVVRQAFWPEFKEAAMRRNRIVHRGASVTAADATATVAAAQQLVGHLEQVAKRLAAGGVTPAS